MTSLKNLKEIANEYVAMKTGRREFLTRLGSAGLGVAAGTIIAGCGGGGSNGGGVGPVSAQGSSVGVSSAEIALAFQDIQRDENDHVTFLKAGISGAGGTPRPRPQFNAALLTAPDVATFVTDSAALENTGTGAYPYVLTNPNFSGAGLVYAQAAGTIAIVEGRHAGFLNALKGRVLLTDPASGDTTGPGSSDLSREIIQAPSEVVQRASPFLGTVSTGSPGSGTTADTYLMGYTYNPNGQLSTAGTAVPADTAGGPGANGTVDLFGILNYALLLEYLERDFYNINVPKFFGGGGPTYSVTGA